jgi:hypothetical protein
MKQEAGVIDQTVMILSVRRSLILHQEFVKHQLPAHAGAMAGVLEFIKVARPIIFQEPGERAVGEYSPAGLASGTVVGFIVGIADSLHGSATDRAWFVEPAVHRHPGTKRGDLFGKAVSRLGAETLDPFEKNLTHGCVEPPRLVELELLRKRQR